MHATLAPSLPLSKTPKTNSSLKPPLKRSSKHLLTIMTNPLKKVTESGLQGCSPKQNRFEQLLQSLKDSQKAFDETRPRRPLTNTSRRIFNTSTLFFPRIPSMNYPR